MRFTTVFCLFLILMFPASSYGLEKLDFVRNHLSPSLTLQMNAFLQESYQVDSSLFDIAAADLNQDGVDEYILKRISCVHAGSVCSHMVLADQNNEMLLLSNIRARHLMVGATSSFGVKDLLAFENEINDYDFDIYMWSPAQKMYILKGENEQIE